MVGDEGSAAGVALKAVKVWIDDRDRKVPAPHPVSGSGQLERVILDYFGVADRFDLLPHLYGNWDKTFFAGLCKRISQVARETGDPLCKYIMEDAGR